MSISSKYRKKPQVPNFRAMLDYFMALLMMFFGAVILFPEPILGVDYFKDSAIVQGTMKWIIGILFILYGFFRAYRGYLASKSREEDEDE